LTKADPQLIVYIEYKKRGDFIMRIALINENSQAAKNEMIYASLNAKKGNYQYPAAIKKALDFLAKPETAELPVGRYELDGDNIFVLIQDQTTAPVENKRAESHRNYIDIQYLFTGKEVQGYAPLLPGVTGEEPAGKDNIFYADVENEQFVTLHPGEFTVFFTNDIHRPNCTMDEPVNIHKAVVKIKESLIK